MSVPSQQSADQRLDDLKNELDVKMTTIRNKRAALEDRSQALANRRKAIFGGGDKNDTTPNDDNNNDNDHLSRQQKRQRTQEGTV